MYTVVKLQGHEHHARAKSCNIPVLMSLLSCPEQVGLARQVFGNTNLAFVPASEKVNINIEMLIPLLPLLGAWLQIFRNADGVREVAFAGVTSNLMDIANRMNCFALVMNADLHEC